MHNFLLKYSGVRGFFYYFTLLYDHVYATGDII